jgi:hypothetical protein
MNECWVCELIAGKRDVPGGIIAGDEHWVVDHCLGPFGVGAFVLKTKEHRDSLWMLTDDETASLGPWLRRLSQAIIDALAAERVYGRCGWTLRQITCTSSCGRAIRASRGLLSSKRSAARKESRTGRPWPQPPTG